MSAVFLYAIRFNTQPPEGGWADRATDFTIAVCFNTQPPEGGWDKHVADSLAKISVSTHSRPKAAGMGQENGG